MPIQHSFSFEDPSVTLETSELARQATGAVPLGMDDTGALAIVVAAKDAKPGQDFSPPDGRPRRKNLRGRAYSRRLGLRCRPCR